MHKIGAQHYRDLRISAFTEWGRAVAQGKEMGIVLFLIFNLSAPNEELRREATGVLTM
jgi:hypothetical protein